MTSLRDANAPLAAHFPGLTDQNHSVESPRSRAYNCIAWAVGLDTMRYWPNHPDMHWPSDLPDFDDELDALVSLFLARGYERCASDVLEEGWEKIAVYTYDDGEPSHAARQLISGRWASKLGYGATEDIEHDSLDALSGESAYGAPTIIMRRMR